MLRGERLAAARDAKKIKDALEQALQLDASLDDAYFGIGLDHYYADVAPTAAKILRWLLFLPGGDRVKGLNEMLQARQRGVLLRGEADYQLHLIYLWYEQQPAARPELLHDLDARIRPTRSSFSASRKWRTSTGTIVRPVHGPGRRCWSAHGRRVPDAARRAIRARLALSAQLDAIDETDRAIEQLRAVLGADPRVVSRADLARAQAQSARPTIDSAARRRGEGIRRRHEPVVGDHRDRTRAHPRCAAAPRLSAQPTGCRSTAGARSSAALERTALARSVELDPLDPVARYRFARVLAARGEPIARRQLVLIRVRVAPAFVLASADVAYAQLLERDGDRARAIEAIAPLRTVGGDSARVTTRAALDRLARNDSSCTFFDFFMRLCLTVTVLDRNLHLV